MNQYEGPKISLKAARVNAGLTIQQVAEKLGITRQTVARYENGKSNPDSSVVMEMCRLYNMPIQFIFL